MSTKHILRSYRYHIIGVKIYFLTIIIIIMIIIITKIWFDEQTDRQPGWCGVRWETKGSFPSTQYILYVCQCHYHHHRYHPQNNHCSLLLGAIVLIGMKYEL